MTPKLIVSGKAPESIIQPANTKNSGYDGPDTIHYFECAWCGWKYLTGDRVPSRNVLPDHECTGPRDRSTTFSPPPKPPG
jgi:hypothetical protein